MKGHQHACGDRLGRGSWGPPVYTRGEAALPRRRPTPLRMADGLEFVQRRGHPLQATIVRDEIEVE